MKSNMKKLVAEAMLTALGVALSAFAIPVGASKCFPIQHLVNVVAAVTLGPSYGILHISHKRSGGHRKPSCFPRQYGRSFPRRNGL